MSKIRKMRIHRFGGKEVLQSDSLEPSLPDAGQVLVSVRAASVNPVDFKIRSGKYSAVKEDRLPYTPGRDVSGVVERCGAQVSKFKIGDEVFGMVGIQGGGYSEKAVLDERALALASLHLARGEDPRVRRFLAGEIAHLDSLDDAVRKRWSIALGFVADRYRQRGDPGRAIATYRKALEIRPNEARVLLNLGLAFADAGDFANAIERYRRSLAADPAQPLAHVNWGIALEALGDTAGGVAEFRRALAVDPNEPLAYFNIGVVGLARGVSREAMEPLARAAALDPGLAPAHFALAQGYLLAGDARAATRELRLGLDFDPDNAAARQLLEQIERATGGR